MDLADYRCPICYELMVNPVVARDGQSYERKYIETWLSRDVAIIASPITNVPLTKKLVDNETLRRIISNIVENDLYDKNQEQQKLVDDYKSKIKENEKIIESLKLVAQSATKKRVLVEEKANVLLKKLASSSKCMKIQKSSLKRKKALADISKELERVENIKYAHQMVLNCINDKRYLKQIVNFETKHWVSSVEGGDINAMTINILADWLCTVSLVRNIPLDCVVQCISIIRRMVAIGESEGRKRFQLMGITILNELLPADKKMNTEYLVYVCDNAFFNQEAIESKEKFKNCGVKFISPMDTLNAFFKCTDLTDVQKKESVYVLLKVLVYGNFNVPIPLYLTASSIIYAKVKSNNPKTEIDMFISMGLCENNLNKSFEWVKSTFVQLPKITQQGRELNSMHRAEHQFFAN